MATISRAAAITAYTDAFNAWRTAYVNLFAADVALRVGSAETFNLPPPNPVDFRHAVALPSAGATLQADVQACLAANTFTA
jgi:hypothetical protein